VDVFSGPAPTDLLTALRSATRARHARLDQAIDGAFTRDGYVAFLGASLAVVEAVEPAIERWRPAADHPSRRERLLADLRGLGAPAPGASAPMAFADASQALGAAYVLEGSALGGQVLARRVEAALGDVPTRYLAPHGGPATGVGWRQFLVELQRHGVAAPASARARACDAACATFDRFIDAFVAAGLLTAARS
jgi:heme oxygenase